MGVINLYEGFEKLSDKKKKKIIDVCVDEFGDKGYTNASTNTIVKNAGISKGTLFNYFGSKKGLFLYILDYITDYYIDYMIKEMKVNNPDFFKRVIEWTELKIRVSLNEPKVYKFFASAYTNIPDELKLEIGNRYKKLYEIGLSLAFDGIDYSKFRDDVDRQKILNIALLVLNGLSEKYMQKMLSSDDKGLSTLNERLEELKDYVSILSKVFYK